jgi:hypothetical protein
MRGSASQADSLPGGSMNQLCRSFAFTIVCQLSIASVAHAQEQIQVGPAKPWSLRAGIGLMADPDAFLMNFEIERFMRDEVAVGFALQLGVDDDYTVVSPMVFSRYVFDFSGFENELVSMLQPYVQGGAGLTHIDLDRSGSNGNGTDFLVSLGAGLDIPLNDTLGVGTRVLVNLIPGEVVNQRIYISWEILSIRYLW